MPRKPSFNEQLLRELLLQEEFKTLDSKGNPLAPSKDVYEKIRVKMDEKDGFPKHVYTMLKCNRNKLLDYVRNYYYPNYEENRALDESDENDESDDELEQLNLNEIRKKKEKVIIKIRRYREQLKTLQAAEKKLLAEASSVEFEPDFRGWPASEMNQHSAQFLEFFNKEYSHLESLFPNDCIIVKAKEKENQQGKKAKNKKHVTFSEVVTYHN